MLRTERSLVVVAEFVRVRSTCGKPFPARSEFSRIQLPGKAARGRFSPFDPWLKPTPERAARRAQSASSPVLVGRTPSAADRDLRAIFDSMGSFPASSEKVFFARQNRLTRELWDRIIPLGIPLVVPKCILAALGSFPASEQEFGVRADRDWAVLF